MTVAVRAVAALVERMLDADGPLPRCARSSACSRALSPRTKTLPGSIPHVPVRRMRPRHRSNPVPPRFRAGDPPVPVVVV